MMEQRKVYMELTHDEFLTCFRALKLLEITTKYLDDTSKTVETINTQTALLKIFNDHMEANKIIT